MTTPTPPTPPTLLGSQQPDRNDREDGGANADAAWLKVVDDDSIPVTPLQPPKEGAGAEDGVGKDEDEDGARMDGGLLAWVQVAAAVSINFNTWGILNTFGIFQTYYESGALFVETSSNISWIGAAQAFLVMALGIAAGPLFDRGHFRAMVATGSFLVVFGCMMLSVSTTYWQALLAQGICVGAGGGLLYMPSMAVLPFYFRRRLGLAVGLAAAGSSLGGIIYPILFYQLIGRLGFGWTVRVMAFVALATLSLPVLFMRMRGRPSSAPRAVLDYSAFTDIAFAVFTLSTMVGFIGLYVALFYISYYSKASGLASTEMAFYMVPFLNAGSIFGRTIPNALSDVVGPFNIFGPAALICAILTFCMNAVTSLGGVVALAVLYGFASGVFVSLPAVCYIRLTADKAKLGTRMGMGFALAALGMLAGGPGGGAVLGRFSEDRHWTNLWVYGGCTMLASGVAMVLLRFWLAKGRLVAKPQQPQQQAQAHNSSAPLLPHIRQGALAPVVPPLESELSRELVQAGGEFLGTFVFLYIGFAAIQAS
ncbi:hypothetical protein HK405_012271, partial [Cladochytrium tenue]